MDFDRFTIALLTPGPDGPQLTKEEADTFQDRHLSHIADLADAGKLVAAGPLQDPGYAGLSILTVPPEEALALKAADPAIQAGIYSLQTMAWLVPGGAVKFAPARFPRSIAEAMGR